MSFRDIYSEIRAIPKMNLPLAQTLTNRALQKIYDESVWSFQLKEGGLTTVNQVQTGLATTTIGADTVQMDATAQAAIAAAPSPFLITTCQFRSPAFALYNVIGYDAGTGIITLDRPWIEPAGTGPYQLYQAYYPAPADKFRRWMAIRDFTNAINLDWHSYKQTDLDALDPQRQVFETSTIVAPYKVDDRPGSSTLKRMLFEWYPQPLQQLPYALYYVADPPDLSSPSDEVQFPLTDEVVVYRAKEQAYLWCEENKGQHPELMKSDWEFLAQAMSKLYQDRVKDIRKNDRDVCDNFISKIRRRGVTSGGPFYSAITGQASVGVFP